MRILYVSKLDGEEWQGPTHSVPKQIKYQSNYDDVYWININGVVRDDWEKTGVFHVTSKNRRVSIKDVEQNFGIPELVVFEGVYEYPFNNLIFEIWKKKIPYIIVPRSALSIDGQKKKRVKKIIGNFIFFKKFVKRASAIHYLTDAEAKTSVSFGNRNALILPNGIEGSEKRKHMFLNKKAIILSYIGRLEIYQKGFDILLEACGAIKDVMQKNDVEIHLYGPDREGTVDKLNRLITDKELEKIVFIHDGVFGTEKEQVLLESDAFIMTSRFEGLPMGLIEALSYGVPCLVTKGTNLSEQIMKEDAGWTAQNTAEDIANMISTFLKELNEIQGKSNNARLLSNKFCWESIAFDSHNKYLERVTK